MPSFGDKNIGRLDVAMHDALRVGRIERVGNLNRQTEQNFHLNRPSADAMLQRLAVQKLHGDECLPVMLVNLMNRADIRMVQRGSGLRLALEAG